MSPVARRTSRDAGARHGILSLQQRRRRRALRPGGLPRPNPKVLIVHFDVHHGNGTQDIFYDDPTVFFYSLHQYPWYPGTGDATERGAREGEGYTMNIPVPAMTPAEDYLRLFEEGLDR